MKYRVCSTAMRAPSRICTNCQPTAAMLAVSSARANPLSHPAFRVDQLRIKTFSGSLGGIERRLPKKLTAQTRAAPASWRKWRPGRTQRLTRRQRLQRLALRLDAEPGDHRGLDENSAKRHR